MLEQENRINEQEKEILVMFFESLLFPHPYFNRN
jgi:hypothetical protein